MYFIAENWAFRSIRWTICLWSLFSRKTVSGDKVWKKRPDVCFSLLTPHPPPTLQRQVGEGKCLGRDRATCLYNPCSVAFSFFSPLLLSSVLSSSLFFKFQQHLIPTPVSSGQATTTCLISCNRWKGLWQYPHKRGPSVPAGSRTAAGPPLTLWPYQSHRSHNKHTVLNQKKKKKSSQLPRIWF